MSFGLGRGRALEPGWWGLSRDSLPPSVAEGGAALDRAWFFPGAARPMELEIGSGKGTFLLQEAARRPETDFLGIEYAGEFFRYAADRLRRHAVSNARLLYVDAVQFLRHWLAPGSVQAIHLYFSDPWPKSRHHKRRVVQDEHERERQLLRQRGGRKLLRQSQERTRSPPPVCHQRRSSGADIRLHRAIL